jgi:hypothetical protein
MNNMSIVGISKSYDFHLNIDIEGMVNSQSNNDKSGMTDITRPRCQLDIPHENILVVGWLAWLLAIFAQRDPYGWIFLKKSEKSFFSFFSSG